MHVCLQFCEWLIFFACVSTVLGMVPSFAQKFLSSVLEMVRSFCISCVYSPGNGPWFFTTFVYSPGNGP